VLRRPLESALLTTVTTYSFFPTKNLTTAEGGAVVAQDPAVALRAKEFHDIGLMRDPDRFRITTEGPWPQEVHEFGLNYRLADVGAALGLSQLKRLAGFKKRRAEITARHNETYAGVDGLRTPPQRDDVDPAWHLYPVYEDIGYQRGIAPGGRMLLGVPNTFGLGRLLDVPEPLRGNDE
jgi:dTDP-4-amino-4,6-dideoxygalactose transaminase